MKGKNEGKNDQWIKPCLEKRNQQEHSSRGVQYNFLKNFAKFTGKHLCWSLFIKESQALRPATLLKSDSSKDVFLII